MNFFDSIVLIGIPSKLRIIPVLKKKHEGEIENFSHTFSSQPPK